MKGINFKEPLFDAVLNGTKTQTRRIVKKPKKSSFFQKFKDGIFDSAMNKIKPKYQVGETVYLKEPYFINRMNHNKFEKYVYDIDWKLSKLGFPFIMGCDLIDASNMDIKYARYFIEITAVRCERLQDISEEDCMREGIIEEDWEAPSNVHSHLVDSGYNYGWDEDSILYSSAREAYAALIDKINGKGTWNSNPYVWVYDFKLLKNK